MSIKDTLVPRGNSASSGHSTFYEFDYAQLEIRVLALASKCPNLIEDINSGKDMHKEFAASLYSKPIEDVTSYERKLAKGFSFQLQYGAKAPSIAAKWNVHVNVAERFIELYYQRYPEIADWQATIRKYTAEHGKYEGERRPVGAGGKEMPVKSSVIPSIWPFSNRVCGGFAVGEMVWRDAKPTDRRYSSFSGTKTKNYPIQGAAADIMLLMLGTLQRYLARYHQSVSLVNTVHDSVLIEIADNSEADKIVQEIKGLLEQVPEVLFEYFRVTSPIQFPVDVKYGKSWGEMLEYSPF